MEQKPPSKESPGTVASETPKKKIDLNARVDMRSIESQLSPEIQARWAEQRKQQEAERAARQEAKQAAATEDQAYVQHTQERIADMRVGSPRKEANPVQLNQDYAALKAEAMRLNAEKADTEKAKQEQQQSKGVWGRIKGWFR